jgi:hypothetical protein
VYNYFKHSLSYIGSDATFNNSIPVAYPSCAVSTKGYVGCAMVQGDGGVPGGLIVLQDNVSPTQPWNYRSALGGIVSSSAWGDYTMTNPWYPGGDLFQTVLWNYNGSSVQPYYTVWGRGADANEYARWKAK